MRALTFLFFFLSLLLISCEENDNPEQDVAPSVTIIKPVTNVKSGEQIPVMIEFADDKGLKHVEITLGSEQHSGTFYHYLKRGISGREDKISYMVDPPSDTDILGSNYIMITCRDNGGNVTIADENFMVVDENPPAGKFIYTDVSLSADTAARAEVVFEAEDNEGLAKTILEMWQVDGSGTKMKLLDSVEHNPEEAKTFLQQHFFKGKTSYQTGTLFRFYLKIYDTSGNLIEIESADTGQVQ